MMADAKLGKSLGEGAGVIGGLVASSVPGLQPFASGIGLGAQALGALGGVFGKSKRKALEKELMQVMGQTPGAPTPTVGVGQQTAAQQMMLGPQATDATRLRIAQQGQQAQAAADASAYAENVRAFQQQKAREMERLQAEMEEERMEQREAVGDIGRRLVERAEAGAEEFMGYGAKGSMTPEERAERARQARMAVSGRYEERPDERSSRDLVRDLAETMPKSELLALVNKFYPSGV
jgi:hypothetical protein